MRIGMFMIGAWLVAGPCLADNRVVFVQQFLTALSDGEEIRAQSIEDQKAGGQEVFASCIRNGERFELELTGEAKVLESTKVEGRDISDVPQMMGKIFEDKAKEYEKMRDICGKMIVGPQKGVDYGPLAAEMPKITARLAYLDETIFK